MAIIPKILINKRTSVVLVGAGDAGRLVAEEIMRHPKLNFEIIGFIDDDSRKQNKNIRGIPVLGKVADIPKIVKSRKINEIIIAIPSASGMQIRRITNKCLQANVRFRIIPGIYEILKKDTEAGSLRDVELEDLIKRKPVNFDLDSIQSYLTDKNIFISGAAGSIGKELCYQIIKFRPRGLIVFDHEENSLNEIFLELRENFPDVKVLPIIGDICDKNKINKVFSKLLPNVVFHSAAYKHVPMMELNVSECINNNVFATLTLAQEAIKSKVKRFIFISTDKAVNPTSIMGVSKRIAEMIVEDASKRSQTCFTVVRFGNVLISRGSVVPLFEKQIKSRQAVTITHRKMQRYFMTLSEAAQLVIQAGALGQGGEIFVLDMGKPVNITSLAKEMIRLSGLIPGRDIPIIYTGTRPGERLNEPLFSSAEKLKLTKHQRIFVAHSFFVNHQKLYASLKRLRVFTRLDDRHMIIREIKKIVPTYKEVCYDRQASDRRWQTD